MSTNIPVVELVVKSLADEVSLKPASEGNNGPGEKAAASAAQQARRRGRPRSGGTGQVVSCRLPSEELRRVLPSVAKALAQVVAERRRQGVTLFRKFAESEEGTRRD